MTENQARLVIILIMFLIGTIFWTAAGIRDAIWQNTCLVAEGKYLDETDYEDCGYKP